MSANRHDLYVALNTALNLPCTTAQTFAVREARLTMVIETIVGGEYAPDLIARWMLHAANVSDRGVTLEQQRGEHQR